MAKNAKMKYKFETKHVAGLPKYRFETETGKPLAVVWHWVGNYKSYKSGEISYMSNNWMNAFYHAACDYTGVTEVASTDYIAWAAGPKANGWTLHIEMVHADTREQFYKALDFYLFWTAYQHYWYDMGRTVDNAENDGWGTVWTHNAVSRHLGGTDHIDPMDYFSKWGVTLQQMINKTQEYLNALYAGDSTKVAAIGEGTIIKTVSNPQPAPPTTAKPVKKAPPKVTAVPSTLVPLEYVVKPGDTLSGIAKKYSLKLNDVIKLNPGIKPNLIKVGQKIKLKSSTPAKNSESEVAKEVIKGVWGNDPQRSTKLKKAGYDPKRIQALVNKML